MRRFNDPDLNDLFFVYIYYAFAYEAGILRTRFIYLFISYLLGDISASMYLARHRARGNLEWEFWMGYQF